MKLTLLGTGVPTPNPNRCGPALVVQVEGEAILMDCGSGTTHQLIRAKLDPSKVNYLFFTHHHFDHNIDYAHFILATWTMGRETPLNVYGPRGTARLTKVLLEDVFEADIQSRVSSGKYKPSEGLEINSQDIDEGFVLEKGKWKLTCTRVDHFKHGENYTLAYRIDADGKSAVFSADTAPCGNLIRLAQGADVLVHEVFYCPELVATGYLWGRHRKEPTNSPADFVAPKGHTLPEQVGKLAKEAKVKKLVLTHFFSDTNLEELARIVKNDFAGEVILGRDLMEIEV